MEVRSVSYLMGIDLGTSSLKTILMRSDGVVVASAASSYQFDSPKPGYSEQDPEVWWKACVTTIRECLRNSGLMPEEIKGVSFSGQMHGAVMLDRRGYPVRKAILHNDARSEQQTAWLKERFSRDEVRNLMMNPIYTGFLLPSLIWVRDMEPENYKRIYKVCLPKDYIKFRLTGVLSTDCSDASATLAFDIRKNRWSGEILDRVGIPKEFFPMVYETADSVGTICAAASEETGLLRSVIVAAGGGDQVMQGIGNGIIRPGIASSNIGTSGQLSYRSDVPVLNPDLTTNTFTSYRKDQWLTMGAIMNAGLSLKWLNSLFGQTDYEAIEQMAGSVPPGSGGVVFLPYLNGERTPHLNPDLSGLFLGVNLKTGRAELTRSVMEGVAFALYECKQLCEGLGLTADTMVASGGGARSRSWLQIQSDIFNMVLKVSAVPEQACVGAAIAAGIGCGVYKTIEEGCQSAVSYQDQVIEPIAANHATYEEYFQLFKETFRRVEKPLERVTLLGRGVL